MNPIEQAKAELERLYFLNDIQATTIMNLRERERIARQTLMTIASDKYARQARFKNLDETVGEIVDAALVQIDGMPNAQPLEEKK